jgi:L-fuconolactonase
MPDRADAHIHLFEGGYQGCFTSRPGVNIDEAACYSSLAADHDVRAALVVGYVGKPWCKSNNEFLARIAPGLPWARPAAHVERLDKLTIETLEQWARQGFVGISCYIFGPKEAALPARCADEVWAWLVEHRWLVSVNSKAEAWSAWLPVLERHGELRVVASHLGLPPCATRQTTSDDARRVLAELRALAAFPGSRVKLSGFYALSDPGYDYPHEVTWPYVEALLGAFGPERLLWGSDCTPCLEKLSFPQTLGLFAKMPFLDDRMRRRIEGANLLEMLDSVKQ